MRTIEFHSKDPLLTAGGNIRIPVRFVVVDGKRPQDEVFVQAEVEGQPIPGFPQVTRDGGITEGSVILPGTMTSVRIMVYMETEPKRKFQWELAIPKLLKDEPKEKEDKKTSPKVRAATEAAQIAEQLKTRLGHTKEAEAFKIEIRELKLSSKLPANLDVHCLGGRQDKCGVTHKFVCIRVSNSKGNDLDGLKMNLIGNHPFYVRELKDATDPPPEDYAGLTQKMRHECTLAFDSILIVEIINDCFEDLKVFLQIPGFKFDDDQPLIVPKKLKLLIKPKKGAGWIAWLRYYLNGGIPQ